MDRISAISLSSSSSSSWIIYADCVPFKISLLSSSCRICVLIYSYYYYPKVGIRINLSSWLVARYCRSLKKLVSNSSKRYEISSSSMLLLMSPISEPCTCWLSLSTCIWL